MKTNLKLGVILTIALALPFSSVAQETSEIDPAVQFCYSQFKNVSNWVDVSDLFTYRFGVAHQLGLCLQDNGLNQATNPNITGGKRIVELTQAIGKDLPEFNQVVMSVLKRP